MKIKRQHYAMKVRMGAKLINLFIFVVALALGYTVGVIPTFAQ